MQASQWMQSLQRSSRQAASSFNKSWSSSVVRVPHASASIHTSSARFCSLSAAPLSAQQYQLLKWVDSYRWNGHLFADINPLKGIKKEQHDRAVLDPASYGLNGSDVISTSGVVSFPDGRSEASVEEIQAHLEATYCASIGIESQLVATEAERLWLNNYIESANISTMFSSSEKRNIYNLLVQSEFFDLFMGKKFTSFKRYGLEGAESALVALEEIFSRSNKNGVEKVVLGMPHRGRLNILVSLLDYPARALFAKVKGMSLIPKGMDSWDDVASHIAQSVTKKFDKSPASKPMTVSLLHNPSHLEAINPVAIGKTKAKQDDYVSLNGLSTKDARSKVLSLQLHGDSAYAGQGIVPETLQMAYLNEFAVGGTVHMIVNNQLGFTTGGVGRNRSSRYSSDIGKIISMPVVHINADNPEAVVFGARLVTDFQRHFQKDIMLDVIGYRKHGHNEVDEPAFTQPIMYQDIRSRKNIVALYAEKLASENIDHSVEKLTSRLNGHLEKELEAAATYEGNVNEHFQGKWKGFGQTKDCTDLPMTGVDVATLKKIGEDSVALHEGFTIHPRLKRGHVDARLTALNSTKPDIDWATAEVLAYESLVRQGFNVRLCGQDVERGTFSQRHHALTDQKSDNVLEPLNRNRSAGHGRFQTVNSHLSEEAVLGFEYGYNWENPKNFNIWEAQFGDFNDGAQIIIDTFVSSGESKWLRSTGITMLLPHGYDGAGPEHSSSRMERFLQMSDDAHDFPSMEGQVNGGGQPRTNNVNMLIANVTTPANYFHLLRRQMIRNYRKPLVVITPKTLLRHPDAVSALADMGAGTHFQTVLPDKAVEPKSVSTVVFVTGKVYYELITKRAELKRNDIVFIRVEELSPFPQQALQAELAKYTKAKKFVWFQEEPSNMGAWSYMAPRLNQLLSKSAKHASKSIEYAGRMALPSPAVGAGVYHKKEVETLFKSLFNNF